MPAQKEITRLLISASTGDNAAQEKLVLHVYNELRGLAGGYLRQERPDHTLQPTALVHEAYLRLVDQSRAQWQNQAHFFRMAAQMMRRVLVDHARKHLSRKRGAGKKPVSITQITDLGIKDDADLLAIDEALHDLEAFDPQKGKIVELRFFAGLTMEKVAQVLEIPLRTLEREWRLARAWLFRRLGENEEDGSGQMAAD